MTDKEALEWALKPFNSTVRNPYGPRGSGLNLIKQFARINRGEIRICTGHALYVYNGKTDREKSITLENCFMGTLFEMDVNAYKGKYSYKGEA